MDCRNLLSPNSYIRHRYIYILPAFFLLKSLFVTVSTNILLSKSSYSIRRATFEDIPNIRQCNIDNLPENYDSYYYSRQISILPELSIIAESSDKELLGYALGKLEPTTPIRYQYEQPVSSSVKIFNTGHIASLAVYEKARGLGIAKSMMVIIHNEMGKNFGVDEAFLHCRVSNIAAMKLYSTAFSYKCVSRLRSYYDDGEDAWFMKCSGLSGLCTTKYHIPEINSSE